MSRDKLTRRRIRSFHRQAGRCAYCRVRMWVDDCATFAARYHISIRVAGWLQCTAEHLRARQDGGDDSAGNVVAACKRCNLMRHRRKVSLDPEQFRAYVVKRLATQRWHDPQVFRARLLLR